MAEPPIVQLLAAAAALFLSILILSAVGRQATKKSFQKRALLASIVLLIAAIISNVLMAIFRDPGADPVVAGEALIFGKKVQGTFDLLFAITIGAFVLATAKPEIDSGRAFINYLRKQLPSPYVFYVFVVALAIIALWVSEPKVLTPPFPTETKIIFPLTFLFAVGLAWVTILVYVPVMLLLYLRKVRAPSSVARDVYLIILGVVGFTITEFVVEIVLSFYGIDGRAVGFVIEMALVGLVAFGVREPRFLEELLVPQAEAQLNTAPTFRIQRGVLYVIPEATPSHAFAIFRDFVTHGAHGLCITRKPPKAVMEEHGLERTPILWLSRVADLKNSLRPCPPEHVALAVERFIGVGRESVILLDGLEYLISHNNFNSILSLLHDLNERISLADAILLLPVDPRAMSEREFALIRREAELITPPAGKFAEKHELEISRVMRRAA